MTFDNLDTKYPFTFAVIVAGLILATSVYNNTDLGKTGWLIVFLFLFYIIGSIFNVILFKNEIFESKNGYEMSHMNWGTGVLGIGFGLCFGGLIGALISIINGKNDFAGIFLGVVSIGISLIAIWISVNPRKTIKIAKS